MSKWDETQKETEGSGGSGGDFLKLGDGESAVVAILGDPETYMAKPFQEGQSPKKRVLLNAFVTSEKAIKILDLSGPTFQELCEARAKFDFAKWLVSIKRKGTGKNTRYTILPEKELNDAQKASLAKVQLVDLEELAEKIRFKDGKESVPEKKPESVQAGMKLADDQIPF